MPHPTGYSTASVLRHTNTQTLSSLHLLLSRFQLSSYLNSKCLVGIVASSKKVNIMKLVLSCLLRVLSFSGFIYMVYGLKSDGVALLALRRHWTYVPPLVKSSWNASDSTPCSWVGVECDNALNVVSLNLSSQGIAGVLGPEIGHLSQLQTIILSDNGFLGVIPQWLGNCSLLEELDLSLNNFTGEIPDALKNLQNLQSLSLYSNMLTGDILESLFQIPYLQFVYLNNNNLNGSIPTSVGNMSEVSSLYLYGNQLSGTIPSSIGNCSKLEELYLNQNQLVGDLPETLNNLGNLAYLDVSHNSLEGRIPLGQGSCKNLNFLDLSFNGFIGGVPPGLGNCSGLTAFAAVSSNLIGNIPSSFGLLDRLSALDLSENRLSGNIPPELGKCKSLKSLHLYTNQLEMEIPRELGMLTELEDLELFNNRLAGEIPFSIWKIPSLKYLLVYNNSLSGELPLEMTELKQLNNISLFNNQFFGVIPEGLGVNSTLLQLDFTNNKFTGRIPPNLCSRKQLSVLNMGQNQLEGSIPSDVGNCSTLRRLILKQNNLTGVLPEFAKNTNLLFVDISENNIGGGIPVSMGHCTNLTSINLSRNMFIGIIPSELGNLVNLQTLNFAHNNLEGPLPPQLSNCFRLERVDLGFNILNGSIPLRLRSWTGLSALILRENRFTGGIPSFLSVFEKLSELQLGGNLFGGEIPPSIGALQNLFYALNVSSNKLIGQVPSELGKLNMLQLLDISQNNLTGTLTALDEIHSIVEVNISYNHFTGPVPPTLMKFLDLSPSSFLGNQGLCINCLPPGGLTCTRNSNFEPCDRQSSSKRGLSKLEVAMISLGSSIVLVFLLLGLVLIFLSCRRSKPEVESSTQEGSSPLLIKLMEATANLNERYIIGRGAHGTVYKASLSPDKVFAVKKIAFAGNKRGSPSMVREIQTAGKIRHRNLVRLEDFWLRKDYGLILYGYMPNGSLHDVLHELNPPPTLDWGVRYKIAIGTAQGLAYLHYDCDPPIVHRDIKPRNILLDSEMEPHIADFGIAKLLDQSSASNPSSSVVGTIGYIAPENAFTTSKRKESDAYSYGIVLLELITRKKAMDPAFMEETDIAGWVRSIWSKTRDIERIADSSLVEELLVSDIREQVIGVLLVALRCTEKEPSKRPTMRDVVRQLLDAHTPMRSKKNQVEEFFPGRP